MARALRLQPHHHTGRKLPRHHTSYAGVSFVMLLAGILLVGVSITSEAASGSGNVSYPAPSVAATITSPAAGSTVTAQPVLVRGVCEPGMVVRLDASGRMIGSAICSADGNFGLKIALAAGQNILEARTFNLDGLEGPASGQVAVKLKGGGALALSSPSLRLSPQAGQKTTWQLSLSGGQPPYAVLVDWGDGTTNLLSAATAGSINPSHVYRSAGSYTANVSIKDAAGQTGYLQELSLASSYAASPKVKAAGLPNLALAWPIYAAAGLLLLSFWLGEKFEDDRITDRKPERGDGQTGMVTLSS